jgi:lysyl-tRNA synthetase class 2
MSDWRPSASLDALRQRAEMLRSLREFFAELGVMEVETPLLSASGASDPHLDSFCTRYTGPGAPAGRSLYLQTSPEFAMKRILAAHSGPIYQICKAFRNGEAGRIHNPEFTILEWYRPGFDYHALMAEVDALLQRVLHTQPAQCLSYAAVFAHHLNLDAHEATTDSLRDYAVSRHLLASDSLQDDRDTWLALLWTHLIEPQLGGDGRPLFVFDYPASQAMLARVRQGTPPVAERFEVYVNGIELANGFQELTDSDEQRRRFEENARQRRKLGRMAMEPDERLLAALTEGLPYCSGVAMGVDRLLLLKIRSLDIAGLLAFPLERA